MKQKDIKVLSDKGRIALYIPTGMRGKELKEVLNRAHLDVSHPKSKPPDVEALHLRLRAAEIRAKIQKQADESFLRMQLTNELNEIEQILLSLPK